MPDEASASVATACLLSWSSGDFARTRTLLADEVVFDGPLGHTEGAGEYVAGVRGLKEIVSGVDVHRVVADGGDVCILYDLLTTKFGAIPTMGWYRVVDGAVTSVRAFFDPRPLLGG